MIEHFPDVEQGSGDEGVTRFGRLTLLRVLPERSADNHIVGLWRCDCGEEKPIPMTRVRNGHSQSCGCLVAYVAATMHRTHGRRYTKEYRTWAAIKVRCHSPSNKDYKQYGAKGVAVCPEWRNSFDAFFAHIGPCPDASLQIDRIDNLRGYEPGNVRWATIVEQSCNRSSSFLWTIRGHRFESAKAAANYFGVSDMTIHRWAKGYCDKRRGTFAPPRSDCDAISKY